MELTRKRLHELLNDSRVVDSVFFGEAHAEVVKRLKRDYAIAKHERMSVTNRQKRDAWVAKLSEYDWSLFGTLTTQGGITAKQINRHVQRWFEMVVERYNHTFGLTNGVLNSDDLTIFWVSEQNAKAAKRSPDRYHIHCLVQCNMNIYRDVYNGLKYNQFNTFDCAWQYVQSRKPFIWTTTPEGLHVKKVLSKFRVQILPLKPERYVDTLSKSFMTNRVKYVCKYLTKDFSNFGFLRPADVQATICFNGEKYRQDSYEYEYARDEVRKSKER